jgi:ferredoxin
LLTYDDDGYVTVRGEVIDVPEAQFAAAREAAANCPEQAIELSDDE